MARFTDKSIAALRPKAERYEEWEGGGFGIRVSRSGGKAWIWVYHFEGRPRRMTFGSYPAMGLADARISEAAARKLLERGIDPADREVRLRHAERAAETVNDLADAYLEKWARPRKRSASEDERILKKDVLPALGRRKAKDINRRDILTLLDKIVDRGAPIAANRTLAVIRRMFGWGLSRDIVTANPCAGVKAPSVENGRDRVLSKQEIAELWRALDDQKLTISLEIRLALKLQLVTGQRKGEVIGAEWSEVDINGALWTIPSEKAKNKLAHRVPLSALALRIVGEIQTANDVRAAKKVAKGQKTAEAEAPRWLFPSPRGGKPITGSAVDHAMRCNCDLMGTPNATPHDLRRTAASQMTSIGISRLVVSKILNHAEAGITAVYDRHSYDGEKRAALDAWAALIEEIVSDRLASSNEIGAAG